MVAGVNDTWYMTGGEKERDEEASTGVLPVGVLVRGALDQGFPIDEDGLRSPMGEAGLVDQGVEPTPPCETTGQLEGSSRRIFA